MSSIGSVAGRLERAAGPTDGAANRGGPSISIAMATYNGARYLQTQLDSLAAQSWAPTELVITDDGSTDATEQIVAAFARTAPFPVRWLRNPQRLGYKGNFVRATELCSAEVIAFCDQDDIWHIDKLERVARVFAEDPLVLLAYHNARIFSDDGARDELFYDTPPGPKLAERMTVPPWHFSHGFTQALRRQMVPAGRFWPQSLDMYHLDQRAGHDVFFFHVASACGRIAYIDAPLVSYRQHAGNVTGVGRRAAPDLLERWRSRLENREPTYGYLARVARAYGQIMTAAAAEPFMAEEFRLPLEDAAARWDALARLYEARARVCGPGTLTQRLSAFGALVRAQAYGTRGTWSFGRKAMPKDFVLGVLLAPAVRRFGYPSTHGDPACRSIPA